MLKREHSEQPQQPQSPVTIFCESTAREMWLERVRSGEKKSCGTIPSHLSCLISKCRCWSVCACACARACMCFCDELFFALHNAVTFTITINHTSHIISHCDLNNTADERNTRKLREITMGSDALPLPVYVCACESFFLLICLTFRHALGIFSERREKKPKGKNAAKLNWD